MAASDDDPDVAPVGSASLRYVLVAVAVGGVIGAEARYGLTVAVPHRPGSWPWSTLLTNLLGCLLIGVLMAVLLERVRPHPLVRPFLGVGVLGGFTTFSTFALDADALIHAHRTALALGYSAASVLGGLVAVAVGVSLTRARGRGRGRGR